MNILFFISFLNLFINLSFQEELIPTETCTTTEYNEYKYYNLLFLLEPEENLNYNSFSYILDDNNGDIYIQNEDFYFDKKTIYKIDKFGQIIFKKTISSTTSFYGGENTIIKINDKKYIFSLNNFGINLIGTENLDIHAIAKNYDKEINSYRNALIAVNKANSEQSYLFAFVSSSEFFLYYYTFNRNSISNPQIKSNTFKTIPFLKIVSCFQTKKNFIECLYINYLYQTEVIVFNENFDLLGNIVLNNNLTDFDNNYFNKAIHYKNEIGIYLYCYQYLEIKELIYDKYYSKYILKNYISSKSNNYIEINTHNKYVNRMDLIKLYKNNFALIEIDNTNENIFYITIFTVYNNDKYLKMRTFDIDLISSGIKFHDILKGFTYNNFISFGFSTQNLSSSCFIVLGYCNSTIENLYTINADSEIKPSDFFNINNNIFFDVLYAFKIISVPGDDAGIHIVSKLSKKKIFKNDVLTINDSIIFGFKKGNIIKQSLTIELAGITSQNPDYDFIEKNIKFSKYFGTEDLKKYYQPEKFLGKATKYNFQFTDNINSFTCTYNYCDSCLYINPSICLTCSNSSNKIAENTNKCFQSLPGNDYYDDETKKMYMKCHSSCEKCSKGPLYKENSYNDLISTNCIECKSNYISKEYNEHKNCILKKECQKLYYIYNNIMFCVDSNNKCPSDYPFLNTLTNECLISCDNIDSNICIDTHKTKLTFEQYINEFRNLIKNGTIERYLNESETGNFFFEEDNITYHITFTNNYAYNNSVSKIDLGQCEDKLKDVYDIDEYKELLILKIDIYEKNILFPKIQYEVYHPDTFDTLNLIYCQNLTMDIEYEVEIKEDELFIYDPTSEYYNDICNTATSESGTDITLSDRKEEFLHKNLSVCDENCKLVGYNSETKNVKCECDILTEIKKNLDELKNMNFVDVFENLQTSLNLKIMKCYKLLFSKEGFITNMGSYIMLGIIIIFIFCLIYFVLKDIYNIKGIIDDILAYKRIKTFEKEEKFYTESEIKAKGNNKKKKVKMHNNIINSFEDDKINRSIKSQNNSLDNMIKIGKNKDTSKRKIQKKKNNNNNKNQRIITPQENKHLDMILPPSLLLLIKRDEKSVALKNASKIENINNKKEKKVKFTMRKSIYELKEVDKSHKKYKLLKLNDYELNILKYEYALKLDERSFFEYYWSLLKRNQLFFFSFFPNVDYNSRIIKFFFFFYSFSIAYTINAMFFNDSTMHKIYLDNGQYYFVHQLPQKIISSIITNIIDIIIRTLSLSERNIISVKREGKMDVAIKLSIKVYKTLKNKFSIFFIICFILLIFFWYYLGCFCAVYKNTQLFLFKDTCLSYLLSLLYPFGIYFIIAICRICSLSNKNNKRICLYTISKFLG